MANSFFAINVRCNNDYYDERGTYHPMVCDDPYVICYCDTYEDARKMLNKESRKNKVYDWIELTYMREDETNITKRYGEYDKRKHRYTEGMETIWWITETEFTKPD